MTTRSGPHRWRADPPVALDSIDKLGDRDVLAASIVGVLMAVARRDGTMYWTDDDGHLWGIAGRVVQAIEVEDPEAEGSEGKPRIGFALDTLATVERDA